MSLSDRSARRFPAFEKKRSLLPSIFQFGSSRLTCGVTKPFLLASSVSVLTVLCTGSLARGASINWDITPGTIGSGDSTITGGTGAWNLLNGNWSVDGGVTDFAWSNVINAFDTAVFGGTAGTVTVSGPIDLGGITFSSAGYTVTGSTLSFGTSTGVIDTSAVGTAGITNVSSALTGTDGLTLNANGDLSASGGGSAGLLQISGTNTGLSGGISITGGIVYFTSAAAAGSTQTFAGSGNVITLSNGAGIVQAAATGTTLVLGNNFVLSTGGGTFRSYGNRSLQLNGTISGDTTLNQTDGGTLVLAGANTYTGSTVIGGGTVQIGAGGTVGNVGAGPITISVAQTAGGLSVNHSDAVTLTNDIILTNGANRAITVADGGASADLTLSGVISGTGQLWKQGPGTMVINGTLNTFSSGIVLQAGVLEVPSLASNTVGTGNFFLAQGGSGTFRYTGPTDSTAQLAAYALQGTGANTFIEVTNPATTLTVTSAIGQSGINGGNNGFTKIGNGTLALTATGTYGGPTVVAAGTLQLAANNAIPATGAVTVTGGTFDLNGFTNTVGAVTVTGGSIINGTLTGTSYTATAGSISTALAGTGALTKNSNGTLTLSGANTYSGGTTLSGGSLILDYSSQDNSKLSDTAALTLNRGTLTLSGTAGTHIEVVGSTTIGGGVSITRSGANTAEIALGAITRNAGGQLDVGSAGLATTTNVNDASGILTGVTLGNGTNLAANDGSGNIVAFTGYAAVTRMESGAKSISSNPLSNVQILDGTGVSPANITLAGTGVTDIANLLHAATGGAATLDLGGTNTLRVGAAGMIVAGTGTSALTIQNGTLTAGGANNTAGELIAAVNSANAATISATIADNGTGAVKFTKAGATTLTLTGTNTYSGGSNLSGGTLSLASAGALGTTGTISFQGGTLQATAANTTDYSARFSTAAGQAYNIDTNGQAVTWATALSSSGGTLTKNGSGTLTLSATNTYTGKTLINAGTLTIAVDAGLGAAPASAMADQLTLNGGTLQPTATFSTSANRGISIGASGGTVTDNAGVGFNITSPLSGSGTFTKTGAGAVTLSNSLSTFTGAYTVTGGRLGVNADLALGPAPTSPIANDITLNGGIFTNMTQATSDTAFSGGSTVTLNANRGITLGSGGGTFQTGYNLTVTIPGVISGSGALVKTDNGTLVLGGANTYTGATTLAAGSLSISSPGNLGAGNLTLTAGTLLYTGSSATITNNIANTAGALSIAQSGTVLTATGAITGLAGQTMTVNGVGTLVISGTGDNAGGRLIVNSGTVVLAKTSGGTAHAVGANGGTDYALVLNGGTAQLGGTGGDQIYVNSAVQVNGGTFDLNGQDEGFDTLTSNAAAGVVTNTNAGTTSTLTLGQNNGTAIFSGTLKDAAGTLAVTKTGTGAVTFSGASSYSGATSVGAGKLIVTGSIAGSTTTVTGGTLGGTGITGPVNINAGGTISPGATAAASAISTLSTGSLTFSGGGTFSLAINTSTINGTTVASSVDAITGNLALGSTAPALALTDLGAAATLPLGDTIPFATYTGTWDNNLFSVGGTPIANGGKFTFGPNMFQLNYNGGVGGNTVVLTVIPEPESYASLLGGLGLLAGLQRFRSRRFGMTRGV